MVICEDRVLLFTQEGLDLNLTIYASAIAGMTGVHYHAQVFSVEMGHLLTLCPRWILLQSC
jgi:hypothetical protein